MIYDCFPFLNELELLELRLHELEAVVDRFVLVEATTTFTNERKPLHYWENRRRFARWNSRIVHVIVEDMPGGPDPWTRDHHQRNSISRGLTGCHPDDVILISDVDEIPKSQQVLRYRDTPGVKAFQQALCYYLLNNVASEAWFGTRMLTYRDLQRIGSAQAVRQTEGTAVPDGGWHFSFLGGAGRIRRKLVAYAHQEFNTPVYLDPGRIGDHVATGADLFGRDLNYRISADLELPEFVRTHPARFSDWIAHGPLFHEDWYDDLQCMQLAQLYERVRSLPGEVIEIGCWEGRSTVALANACHPKTLLAVDTWMGNLAEDPEHATVQRLRERDVWRAFLRNLRLLTAGNVQPVVADSQSFWERHRGNVKFCHIDGSHDYASVHADIAGGMRFLVPGGILCGDDYGPHAPGVIRAVDELLPGFEHSGKLWFWQRPT
jgi:beta-1,4-mannosyl-glycoprotein beta-1,4-N-acetylglucosaminyltransferase